MRYRNRRRGKLGFWGSNLISATPLSSMRSAIGGWIVDCGRYRELYEQFMSFPLPREVWESANHMAWQAHGLDCHSCGGWDRLMRLQGRGVDLADYPCVHVAYHSTQTCDIHSNAWECPDMTLVRTAGGFGIPVRDGGTSVIQIEYCPWCGINLYMSKDRTRHGN